MRENVENSGHSPTGGRNEADYELGESFEDWTCIPSLHEVHCEFGAKFQKSVKQTTTLNTNSKMAVVFLLVVEMQTASLERNSRIRFVIVIQMKQVWIFESSSRIRLVLLLEMKQRDSHGLLRHDGSCQQKWVYMIRSASEGSHAYAAILVPCTLERGRKREWSPWICSPESFPEAALLGQELLRLHIQVSNLEHARLPPKSLLSFFTSLLRRKWLSDRDAVASTSIKCARRKCNVEDMEAEAGGFLHRYRCNIYIYTYIYMIFGQ